MQDIKDETREIPTDQIVEPWVILRVVNRSTVEYLELRDSIAEKGFFNSLCVRPSKRKPGKYEVVDGLYRYTVGCELRLLTLPCIVKHNLTDDDVLTAQIQANALRLETTPVEYARQLRKIMAATDSVNGDGMNGDGMTMVELSTRIHKNPEWIGRQLALLDLIKVAQIAVDRGEIPLASAYALARAPRNRQGLYLEAAKTMPIREFLPIIGAFVKQHRENINKGKWDDFEAEFQPVSHLRNLKEVLAEYREHRVGSLFLASLGCETPVDAWYLALQWALHLDEASVNEQRERVLQRQQRAVVEREEKDGEEEP